MDYFQLHCIRTLCSKHQPIRTFPSTFHFQIKKKKKLYMRYAMKETQLSDLGMVYYNNVLSIPAILPIFLMSGEISKIFEYSRY